MFAPTLPMNVVNRLVKKACASNKDNKYFQFKWNKFSGVYEMRWFFRKCYQRSFVALNACIKYKSNNPPEIIHLLTEKACEKCIDPLVRIHKEYDNFIKKLRWTIKYEFPEKKIYYEHNYQCEDEDEDKDKDKDKDEDKDEDKNEDKNEDKEYDIKKYTYFHFENENGGYDCAFIEENSCEDSFLGDYWEPMFHRAYVSINNAYFPFFKEPDIKRETRLWNEEKPCVDYYSITYLNKERGMQAKLISNFTWSFVYFNAEKNEWIKELFQPFERRQLVSFYEVYDEDCYIVI